MNLVIMRGDDLLIMNIKNSKRINRVSISDVSHSSYVTGGIGFRASTSRHFARPKRRRRNEKFEKRRNRIKQRVMRLENTDLGDYRSV